tara:strand:+ start:501 stop:836 length:336 start_codon:yes stop_codon:yes gene_type:complete
MKFAMSAALGTGACRTTFAHVVFFNVSYSLRRARHAGSLHDGAGAGVGALVFVHANWTLDECWHPAATSAAVLNQQVFPDSTPAAQSGKAWHNEQQLSFVVAGAESRLPWP